MDNTVDYELSLKPTNHDATCSRDKSIPTEVNPAYELHTSVTKEVKPTGTKEAPNNTKFNTVLITMTVILLLLTLTSIALSATIFNQLSSEVPKLAHQLDKNEDTRTEHKLTQLIQMQNNISQIFAQLGDQLNDIISAQVRPQNQSECGPGLWWRVAYLDMTDLLQQCPSAWRKYNTSGVKACGRPTSSTGSCVAEVYCTNRQYSRVCGRIIGYQVGSPDAFTRFNNNNRDLDGVIISHGARQEHIWSYAAGVTESSQALGANNCPCSTVAGSTPPTHIGEQHYCESGNPTDIFEFGQLYSNDPLWDGQQCEGTCCTGTKSPPWFSVQLPAPTTDIIEVSICSDEGTNNEDIPVELIEIYVQ